MNFLRRRWRRFRTRWAGSYCMGCGAFRREWRRHPCNVCASTARTFTYALDDSIKAEIRFE